MNKRIDLDYHSLRTYEFFSFFFFFLFEERSRSLLREISNERGKERPFVCPWLITMELRGRRKSKERKEDSIFLLRSFLLRIELIEETVSKF